MSTSTLNLVVLFVLFALSLIAAWVLYSLLQSVAEGEYFGFKLGGAVTVFIVVFLLLRETYGKLPEKNIVRMKVSFPNDAIPKGLDDNTECTIEIYSRETLKKNGPQKIPLVKEGGALVLYVESKSQDDLISVTLRSHNNEIWKSEFEALHVVPLVVNRV